MSGKLGWFVVVLALALPAAASNKPGSISGIVRNSGGTPQMGAAVEVYTSATQPIKVFTDTKGFFKAASLSPAIYQIKISAPSFLPTVVEKINLKPGAALMLHVTLSTLFEALQMSPPQRRLNSDDDDWKWTLRSQANRPILRAVEGSDPKLVAVSGETGDHALKGRLAFVAGSEAGGFGSAGDMSTAFVLEHSLFSSGTVSLGGNVGYGAGASPGSVVRAAYAQQLPDGSRPEVALTVRRFASPDVALRSAALQALALTMSDSMKIGDFLDLSLGSELESVQFMGRVNAIRPFGSVDVHASPNTLVEYRFATSEPTTRMAKGFDTAPADLSESGPHMSLVGWTPQLEHARHHEVSVSRKVGKNTFEVAAYSDHLAHAALTGVGVPDATGGDFLPDVYSGTFTYNAGDLDTHGVRVVAERRLAPDFTGTLDYAYGGVLDLEQAAGHWSTVRSSMHSEYRHTLAAKLSGRLPGSRTRWIASYKWMSGEALTPVDLFNVSAGQSDPYLNFFVRQPLPCGRFMPGKMEAVVELRNLLAQGYIPVMGQDGRTVYLVQSARAVRGGLAFTF